VEIQAASLAQVQRARNGRLVLVDDDVCGVVQQIQQINSTLRVRWSEISEHFAVYQVMTNGEEKLVTTALELDARLVERIRRVTHPDYNAAVEADFLDAERIRQADYEHSQKVGELGEQLLHAIRRDKNDESRIHMGGRTWRG
jgi:methylthioribose-1-phosphate isomerase